MEADKEQMTQTISNLLSNSIKFTNGRNITIKIKINDHIIITIKDTGKDIDPEIMPRLFTKFATKSEKGTGLGLFISKSIIEAHGGRIWAKNNEDGRGATFEFTLPIKQQNKDAV